MTTVPALLPCPHCGNQPLPTAIITERGVERVWCAICFSSARLDVWNRRDGCGLHLASLVVRAAASITNPACLNDLDPALVATYLDREGFAMKRTSGLSSIWEKSHGPGGVTRVYLPSDRELADYAGAMGRVIRTLTHLTGRNELLVYLEILGHSTALAQEA